MEKSAKITVAERKLKRLMRERGRFVDAAKTGKLRIRLRPGRDGAPQPAPAGGRPDRADAQGGGARRDRGPARGGARQASRRAVREADRARLARIEQLRAGLRLHDEAHDPLLGTGKRLTAEQLTHHFGTVPVGADDVARTRLGALHEYRTSLEEMLQGARPRARRAHAARRRGAHPEGARAGPGRVPGPARLARRRRRSARRTRPPTRARAASRPSTRAGATPRSATSSPAARSSTAT
jgi:hypothetical protein